MKIIFWLLALTSFVFADETAWLSGSVNTTPANWTNPDSAFADDTKYARYANSGNDVLFLSGFSVDLSSGSTVDSIAVRSRGLGAGSQAPRRVFVIGLSKDAAATAGDEVNFQHGTTEDLTEHTGVTGLWQTTWTEAEVEATNFGVGIFKNGNKADGVELEQVEIKIIYTPAAAGGAQTNRRQQLLQQRQRR